MIKYFPFIHHENKREKYKEMPLYIELVDPSILPPKKEEKEEKEERGSIIIEL